MATGFKLLGQKRRLIGIQATSCALTETSRVVLASALNTAPLLGLPESSVSESDFELEGRFNGGAYGHLDETTSSAIKLMASTEGILTDPVYTGKAVAGLLGLVREGGFGEAKNVLFVHTGGSPALSAYPSLV